MASKFVITAELSLQTKNLTQVVRNLQSQFNNANLNIKIKDLAQAQSHIAKISSSSKQASKDVGVLGSSMEQAFKRFTVITAVTGTLIAFTRAVKNSISEAISFEREVVKIAQATGQTTTQLSGLVREINDVSTTFGVASKELILASRSLTQAGFAADKVAGALKILAQTELAATFDSIQDTTEGTIALLNQFGQEAQRTGTEIKFLEKSFSAINQVSKEFAVESADLVTAIRATGSAFESAGGTLDELLALFTSVRSTTRESAESIATGFRTIFTRVQRVDTINALRNLGIELQDAEGKFVGPLEAVKRLSAALNTIDPRDFRFNLVVEELGGFRQVSKVIPLIQQFAVTQKALNVAQNSSGSLAKDAQTAQQALAVQIAKTREEFQKFIRDMVATDSFQSTVKRLLDISSAFLSIADSIKGLVPLISAFASIKLGAALIPALRSFSGGGKRSSVPIGFATGGLVPGSGHGDTVPAMLTPGEFVIKKDSVNKLGAHNLARMNKYAKGGTVKDKFRYEKPKVETAAPYVNLAMTGAEVGGLPGNTKVQGKNSKGIPIGIGVGDDNVKMKVSKKAVYIHPDDIAKYKIAFGGGETGSAGQGFESLLSEKLGYTALNNDPKFPFDLQGPGNVLADAKDKPQSAVNHTEGISKGFNYLLYKSLPGYKYSDIAKQTINVDEEAYPLQYNAGKLTSRKDNISPNFKVQLLYPKALADLKKQTKDVQKFAGGGVVKNILDEKRVGVAVLEPSAEPKRYQVNTDGMEGVNVKKTWDVVAEGLSPESFKTFRGSVETGLVKGLESAANKASSLFSEDLGLGSPIKLGKDQIKDFLGGVSRSAYGNLFDQVLTLYKTKKFSSDDPGRPFDFVHGISGVLKDDYKNLEGINYVDAKSSFYAAGKGSVKKKIMNTILNIRKNSEEYKGGRYLQKGYRRALRQRDINSKQVESKITSDQMSTSSLDFQRRLLSISQKGPISEGAAGDLSKNNNVTDFVKYILGASGKISFNSKNPVFTLTNDEQEKILNALAEYKASGVIKKFATGGLASGTDTVPAMLTPGEFVVNKKSAEQIGYGTLNRMNKVAKFAQGGQVGKGGSVFDPDEQRKSAAKFISDFSSILDPKQVKRLSDMLNGIINAGNDAEKAIKQMRKDINIRTQNPNIQGPIRNYLGSSEDIKAKTAKYVGIGKEGRRNKEYEVALGEMDKVSAKLKDLSNGSSQTVTNLLLLAGTIETVMVQFTALSDSQKAAASAFGASLAIYSGISSELKKFGVRVAASIAEKKKETIITALNSSAFGNNTAKVNQNTAKQTSPAVARLEKTFSIIDGAFTGFSVAMAAASAMTAYYSKVAETSSKNMSETVNKFKEDFKSVSKATLGDSIKNAFVAESQSKIVGGGLGKTSSIATIGASAATGAGVGAMFGPLGAAIGGVAGGLVGLYTSWKTLSDEFEKSKDKIASSAETLTSTLYETSKANIRVRKFLDEIQTKTLDQTLKETADSIALYKTRVDASAKGEKGLIEVSKTFGEIPEVIRNTLDDAAGELTKFKTQIDQLVGASVNIKIKDINNRIGSNGYDVVKDINAFTASLEAGVKESAANSVSQRYSRVVSGFDVQGKNTADLSKAIESLGIEEGNKAFLELQKQVNESTVQIINQNIAMAKELKIREELLGALSEQVALQSGIQNINYTIDQNAMASKAMDSIYSGVVSGLKNNLVSSSILDVNNPTGQNKNDFDKALQLIGDFSPLSKSVQSSLAELNKFMPNIDMILESINYSQFEGDQQTRDAAVTKLLSSFGVDLASEAGKGLAKAFDKTFNVADTGTKEGGYTRKERQDLLRSNLGDVPAQATKFGKDILDIIAKIDGATREYRDKILQSQQKEIEIRLAAIDAQKNSFDLIQRALTGKGLTLTQSDAARLAKQRLLAGDMANNPVAIGKEIAKIRTTLSGAGLSAAQQQALQSRAKKLEVALADLADQSGRTSDIMSKIDEFRSQRETLSESAKDYAFGTQEDKMRSNASFEALRTVLNSGDINSVADEFKGAVKELLTRFKDVPLFNNMTGSQIENELAAREMQKMGNFDMAAMLRTQTSTPEQKLIKELQKTANDEMVARRQILDQELVYQDANTKAIIDLTVAITAQQEQALKTEQNNKDLIQKNQGEFGIAPDIAILNKNLKDIQITVKTLDQALIKVNDGITNITKTIDESIKILSAPKPTVDNGVDALKALSTGGIVYRAGGGSIFKPKGTDTVPAMLTPGEYVMKKSTVDKMGKSTMDAINAGYFASGGRINRLRQRADRRRQEAMQNMDYADPIDESQLGPNQMVAQSQSGLQRVVTNVRGIDRRAERLRRESSEYARTYADQDRDRYRSQYMAAYRGDEVPKINGVEEFGTFVSQFKEATTGMTMSHTVTVDGQLNIGGIDGNAIANQIKEALGNYVGQIVQQYLNKQNRRPGT